MSHLTTKVTGNGGGFSPVPLTALLAGMDS